VGHIALAVGLRLVSSMPTARRRTLLRSCSIWSPASDAAPQRVCRSPVHFIGTPGSRCAP